MKISFPFTMLLREKINFITNSLMRYVVEPINYFLNLVHIELMRGRERALKIYIFCDNERRNKKESNANMCFNQTTHSVFHMHTFRSLNTMYYTMLPSTCSSKPNTNDKIEKARQGKIMKNKNAYEKELNEQARDGERRERSENE